VLYIAEGYKRDRNTVSICNSDAAVMQLAQECLLCVGTRPAEYCIQYHRDQDLAELRASGEPRFVSILTASACNENRTATSWRAADGVRDMAS
jgi:hypothetical protein